MRLVRSGSDDEADIVAVLGDFDALASALELTEYLDGCVTARQDALLDLSQTEFIDSAGLGLLVSTCRRLEEVGRLLVLIAPHPNVVRILQITGLAGVLTTVPSVEAARAVLS
jgi:anti-sigma B factor antagonist